MRVRLIVSGRGYDAATGIPDTLELTADATVDDALRRLAELLPAESPLAPSCLVAVAGTHLGTVARHETRALREGDELVIVAPVAGG